MRRRSYLVLLATCLAALPAFSPAFTSTAGSVSVPVPGIASDNVELLFTLPDSVGAFSTAFDPTRPYMYVNTGQGISVYDTTDPAMPLITGRLELPHFENEGMTVGQRANGDTFVLIGIDLAGVSPADGQYTTSGTSFYVADVTDPAAPYMRSYLKVASSTHTIACANADCTIAYTSGVYQKNGKFEAIDLTDLSAPKVLGEVTNINGGKTGYGVHQWTFDDAGYLTGAAGGGTGIYDISDPMKPVALNTTNQKAGQAPYNDFIQHNAERPNGSAMTIATTPEEVAAQKAMEYSPANGNVMVITEEDYDSPDCQGVVGFDAPEGGVSTWGIPYLSGDQQLIDNPTKNGLAGTIEPLDTWNSELYDTGVPTPAGALCSAHYFTYHDGGFIAQGWYAQGTRILDIRDPRDIKQVGYFIAQASETWNVYWAPERDSKGHVTGRDTNIAYTNDAVRGVDVLKITLPTTPAAATEALVAPVLSQWFDKANVNAYSVADASIGYMCRLGTLNGLHS